MQAFITDRLPQIEELCRTHHVQRLSIFGSAVRDDFDPDTSDVDVRVQFGNVGLERYASNAFSFLDALSELLGRKVDMISGREVKNPGLRTAIERSQVHLYAA